MCMSSICACRIGLLGNRRQSSQFYVYFRHKLNILLAFDMQWPHDILIQSNINTLNEVMHYYWCKFSHVFFLYNNAHDIK